MRILIIANQLKGLNAKTDTALGMLREALQRGHQVSWATPPQLSLMENRIFVQDALIETCEELKLPQLHGEDTVQPLKNFDTVWIRRDPPFDPEYLSLSWLLALEEAENVIINPPSLLARYHEKMLPFEAVRSGFLDADDIITTFMPRGSSGITPKDFPAGPTISKPWFGHGGRDVEKWSSLEEALTQTQSEGTESMLYQPFHPRVLETGDRRVIFIDGNYAGDVVRIPPEGSIRANLVQGARGELRPMSEGETRLTEKIERFLKSTGLLLAGADYIDEKLTEINITAPTGFETIRTLGGPNLRATYLDMVERLVKK